MVIVHSSVIWNFSPQFKVLLSEASSSAAPKRLTGKRAIGVTFDPVTVPENGVVTMVIRFAPPTDCHWTENAPSAWQVLTGVCILCNVFGDVDKLSDDVHVQKMTLYHTYMVRAICNLLSEGC